MPDSLKNMVSSVDWSKLMSSQDAKNALIGSALGGLMMGGASALSDRDPEESKYAPVGDALVGALLGGAAGYGIPKGLALFRDAGSMAPDNDRISGGAGGAALAGLGAGTLAAGGILAPTAWRAFGRLRNNAAQERVFSNPRYRELLEAERGKLQRAEDIYKEVAEQSAGRFPEAERAAMLERLQQGINGRRYKYTSALNNAISTDNQLYGTRVSRLKRAIKALNESNKPRANKAEHLAALKHELSGLRGARYRSSGLPQKGHLFDWLNSLAVEMGNGAAEPAVQLKGGAKLKKLREFWANLTNGGKHYAERPYSETMLAPFFPGKMSKPMGRVLGRAGRYGLAGAGLGYALNKLFGPSAKNNFKN